MKDASNSWSTKRNNVVPPGFVWYCIPAFSVGGEKYAVAPCIRDDMFSMPLAHNLLCISRICSRICVYFPMSHIEDQHSCIMIPMCDLSRMDVFIYNGSL